MPYLNTYILKKNIQRKQGLKMTNKMDEIVSASKDNFKVAQLYMKNTYLINKRKINLRLYLLITCHNGKVKGYLHKQGKCIYTNKDFNHNDLNHTNNTNTDNVNNVNNTNNIERFNSTGNLNDASSKVVKMKQVDRDYNMLEELNTRPRTSYLAKIRNPNPELL